MLRSRFTGLFALLFPFVVALPPTIQTQQPKPQPPRAAAVRTTVPITAPAKLPDSPVSPARVSLSSGQLTVDARNSELNQILQEIARLTGMSLSGLSAGKRVFGVYGPSDPRSVLTSLLQASGYNFLLIGGSTTPRQLVLMPESKAPPTVAKAPPPQSQPDESDDQYVQQDPIEPY
jgi:hypothetical protein